MAEKKEKEEAPKKQRGFNKVEIEIIKDTDYLVKGEKKLLAPYLAMELVNLKLAKLVK